MTKLHDIFIVCTAPDTQLMKEIYHALDYADIDVISMTIHAFSADDERAVRRLFAISHGAIIICPNLSDYLARLNGVSNYDAQRNTAYLKMVVSLAVQEEVFIIPYQVREFLDEHDLIKHELRDYPHLIAIDNAKQSISELVRAVKERLISQNATAPSVIQPPIKRLTARNPIHWWCLLWWIFVKQDTLATYKHHYGRYSLYSLSGWVYAGLFLIPFLIPLSATYIYPADVQAQFSTLSFIEIIGLIGLSFLAFGIIIPATNWIVSQEKDAMPIGIISFIAYIFICFAPIVNMSTKLALHPFAEIIGYGFCVSVTVLAIAYMLKEDSRTQKTFIQGGAIGAIIAFSLTDMPMAVDYLIILALLGIIFAGLRMMKWGRVVLSGLLASYISLIIVFYIIIPSHL